MNDSDFDTRMDLACIVELVIGRATKVKKRRWESSDGYGRGDETLWE